MTFRILPVFALVGLAACATQIPDSNPSVGVGFSDYDAYATERARRDAELQAMRQPPVPEGQAIAAETLTALRVESPLGGSAPVSAGTANEPNVGLADVETRPIPNNPDISDEQNFDAVASRETIESDADRIQRNREAFSVSETTALPERGSDGRPNVVAFALATTHPVGTQVYRRSGSSSANRFARECGRYASPDLAQEAFLSNGGPQRDRRGMDPDGDGYACFWDPSPFRAARGG